MIDLSALQTRLSGAQDTYRYDVVNQLEEVARTALAGLEPDLVTIQLENGRTFVGATLASGDTTISVLRFGDQRAELEELCDLLCEISGHLVALGENDGDEIELQF